MTWLVYALIGVIFGGVSDFLRKIGSNLRDPFFANLVFQFGSIIAGVVLFLLFSRKVDYQPRFMLAAFVGGILISTFTLFSFKALTMGPGVSTVMPVLRIGSVAFISLLGIVILREQITVQKVFGLLFSAIGIYLLFANK